ncbi:MAG: ATP-binding protein [Lachnospiraceae bacterium]|nr:ATP-binding protein [Lachnospiraceae bacterium]
MISTSLKQSFSRDSVYREIMTDYERQLAQDKREQRSRMQELYIRMPRYKDLEHRTADISAEAAIKAASGLKAEASELIRELTRISEEKKQMLAAAGIPDDYISVQYRCNDCKDTGYVNGKRCHCLVNRLIETNYFRSGIYDKLKEENFSTFSFEYFEGDDLKNIKSIHAAAKKFVKGFADSYTNMLFYGGVGSGKSFMSNCIAKALLDKGVSVVYISAIRLFDIMSDHMFGRDRDSSLYEGLLTCPLLIIDDLGTEVSNSATSSELFELLNERDLSAHSTIISTNLTLDEIKDRYSDRSISRIIGNYDIYRFTGDDLRLKKTEVSLSGAYA